jgi:hypothetical protein
VQERWELAVNSCKMWDFGLFKRRLGR